MGLFSFAGDALDFEKFHAKDLWRGIKKDPKRLLLGVDPWSTKVWNKILNRDDEPLVDQMGGAYGGHTFSAFGNKDGGVYGRAEAAGVPTGAGGNMQDAAHLIAAFYGGKGLMNIGGGNGASTHEGTHAQNFDQSNMPMNMQQQQPQQQQQEEAEKPEDYRYTPPNPAYQQTSVTQGVPITYTKRLARGLMRG
jgi:hypothetical protein